MNRPLAILLVDDEVIVRQSIVMLLKRAGHEVVGVGDGEIALEIMARRTFDLVISDLSMPGMQGDELVERIRQIRPAQHIIMVTAFVDEYRIFGRETGNIDALLLKPFMFHELTDTIKAVMADTDASASITWPAPLLDDNPANARL